MLYLRCGLPRRGLKTFVFPFSYELLQFPLNCSTTSWLILSAINFLLPLKSNSQNYNVGGIIIEDEKLHTPKLNNTAIVPDAQVAKGPFTNYVDKILVFFDHLPPCVDILYGINVDNK